VECGYLNREKECAQTMLCPEYKDRVLLMCKGKTMHVSCASIEMTVSSCESRLSIARGYHALYVKEEAVFRS
jgi:hypothetical protein